MIHDVVLINCKKVINERGFLQEITREDQDSFFSIGQTYITKTINGVIKAWYQHQEQWDSIFVIQGEMKMALYDMRKNSPSYKQLDVFIISGSEPQLIRIPPGVWHGFQALKSDLLLLHMNSHPFDFNHPDEIRIDPHSPEIPFDWNHGFDSHI